jgi:hypothetical protein
VWRLKLMLLTLAAVRGVELKVEEVVVCCANITSTFSLAW